MLALTQSTTFIIGPVAKLLGYIMEFIYKFLDSLKYPDIGLCIILFTIAVYLILLPMTIKQQKFSKVSAVMNPEIKAIQDKYRGKNDQESMMRQNDEIRAVYEKYGSSPTGGCLQLLIQFPILFGLYRVIMNIPAYVRPLKNIYKTVADTIVGSDYAEKFTELVGTKVSKFDIENTDKVIDGLYQFSSAQWEELKTCGIEAIETASAAAYDKLDPILNFFGLNLAEAPSTIITNAVKNVGTDKSQIGIIIIAILIPVLAGVFQYLTTKLSPTQNMDTGDNENTMMSSLKTMNTIMPLMSVVFCFSFASGIGLYWAFGAIVRCIQQFCINIYLNRIDVDDIVKKNIEKVNRKREKQGLPPQTVSNAARMNVRTTTYDAKDLEEKRKNREESIRKSSAYYNSDAQAGSLRSKADMVKKFNEKNNK